MGYPAASASDCKVLAAMRSDSLDAADSAGNAPATALRSSTYSPTASSVCLELAGSGGPSVVTVLSAQRSVPAPSIAVEISATLALYASSLSGLAVESVVLSPLAVVVVVDLLSTF